MNISLKVFPLDDDAPDDEESCQVVRKFFDLSGEPVDVLLDLVRRDVGLDLVQPLPEGLDLGHGLLSLPGGREWSLNFVARYLWVKKKVISKHTPLK